MQDPCPLQLEAHMPPSSPVSSAAEQSMDAQPISQTQVPLEHAPCALQLLMHAARMISGDVSSHASPPNPSSQRHIPLTHTPRPEQFPLHSALTAHMHVPFESTPAPEEQLLSQSTDFGASQVGASHAAPDQT